MQSEYTYFEYTDIIQTQKNIYTIDQDQYTEIFYYNIDTTLQKREYYKNGLLHCDNVPAIICYYNTGAIEQETWYKDGKIHRVSNPALIRYEYIPIPSIQGPISEEHWFIEGKLHNDNGPAVKIYNTIIGINNSIIYDYCIRYDNIAKEELDSTVKNALLSIGDYSSYFNNTPLTYRRNIKTIQYFKTGLLHREDNNPAVIEYTNDEITSIGYFINNILYKDVKYSYNRDRYTENYYTDSKITQTIVYKKNDKNYKKESECFNTKEFEHTIYYYGNDFICKEIYKDRKNISYTEPIAIFYNNGIVCKKIFNNTSNSPEYLHNLFYPAVLYYNEKGELEYEKSEFYIHNTKMDKEKFIDYMYRYYSKEYYEEEYALLNKFLSYTIFD